jgi:hypothetical protein
VKTFKLALFSWLEVGDAASENSTEKPYKPVHQLPRLL